MHHELQAHLGCLETEVRRKVAGIRVEPGRTKGEKFFLFSYRTFSMPESSIDPVVVGMTFTPADHGVTVDADVSGERTGDLISSAPAQVVGNSRDELVAAVNRTAGALCQSPDLIAAALRDSARRVE